MYRLAKLSAVLLSLSGPAAVTEAQAQTKLAPFKDKLFAYPAVLERSKDGSYMLVEYNRERDMIKRDKIPRRRVHDKYVDTGVAWSRRVRSYKSPNGTFKYFAVGKRRNAKVTVIYVHGRGGNRRQGVNSRTFGGNFNRLQNLMNRNSGLLLTPDFSNFSDAGAADIASLARIFRKRAPSTKLIVACGSAGGGVCWRMARNPDTARLMNGMFILGSHWDDAFLKSATARKGGRNIPIYIGHGGADPVFKPSRQKAFFEKIKRGNPSYPIRFVMFDTGAHGTPIRMVDWRRELNWMLGLNK